ncbi:MAG: hypothetical protein LBS58_00245 [Coriobacteriales bacterium]|nr:hypothetical protein [Coriobacteriales bacterium]
MTNGDMSPARMAKARRTGAILIVVILLLVAALAGLGYLAYTFLFEPAPSSPAVVVPAPDIENPPVDDNKAPEVAPPVTASIPGLAALFGLSIEEVQAYLGPDFQLVKTEVVAEEENKDIKQLATLSYSPRASSSSSSSAASDLLPVENIYASLNEQGDVIGIYYVCSMDLLGYPASSFETLVASQGTLDAILRAAGVTPANFNYRAPSSDQYLQYVDPAASPLKVKKESYTFEGASTATGAPTAWKLTLTYDYGAGVDEVAGRQPLERMLYLDLQ